MEGDLPNAPDGDYPAVDARYLIYIEGERNEKAPLLGGA